MAFIDTHTHTQFWEKQHFDALDNSALILSLDSHLEIPEQIEISPPNSGIYYAYGLQPCTVYDGQKLDSYLCQLEEGIKKEQIRFLGELGLDSASPQEVILFEEQLKMARDYKIPVIAHTPKKNKLEIAKKILSIMDAIGIRPHLGLIDHVNQDILDHYAPEYYLGITIQEKHGKLSLQEGIEIVLNNPQYEDNFVINSDYSNLPFRKQLVVEVNTVGQFQNQLSDLDSDLSISVTQNNPRRFLGGKK